MSSIKLQYRHFSIDPDLPVFCFNSENRPANQLFALNDGDEIRYMHLHNCIEIACVATGGGEFCLDDHVYPLEKDDMVVVMPYCTHIIREQHEGPYCDYLYFDPVTFLREFCPDALPLCEIFESKNSPACAVLRGESVAPLMRRVQEIMTELKKNEKHSRFCIKGLLLTMIVELVRLLGNEKHIERRVNSVAPIMPAIRYINEHFSEPIHIETLQDICHLSGTHFRRLFNSIMGCAPLEYIHSLRVNRACDMLLSSDASILNISLSVGFDSVSSFNRQFVKIMGVSPSVWRRERVLKRGEYLPVSAYDGHFCSEKGT